MNSKIYRVTIDYGNTTLGTLTYITDKPPDEKGGSGVQSIEVTEGTVVWGPTQKKKWGWIDV